ncbi:MAG: hypothetical protein AAB011_05700 [Candidatus Eisenbacteria bacterium]|mgnify:CR=1 FL=1
MVAIADREERKKRLREKSAQARKRTDEILDAEAEALHRATAVDLEALRPRVTDPAAYEEYLRIVRESTQRNEDLAQFRSRLGAAGKAVRAVAKELARLLGHR